jgi:hypothetical protein
MATDAAMFRLPTTLLSRFAAMGWPSRETGIFLASLSGPELQNRLRVVRDRVPGLRVATLIGVVSTDPKREDSTMARSVIHTPRTRQSHKTLEQRPVLQLPLEAPRWGEPPSTPQPKEQSSERGVAVIDFFI